MVPPDIDPDPGGTVNPHLRRTVIGALAAGTAAAALVVPFSDATQSWTPVVLGLHEDPAAILPATVSPAQPVSVVSTALDEDGRPVVTTRRATDRTAAERLVRDGQQAPRAVAVELDAPVHADAVPAGDDPYRSSQWDLTKIQTPTAWQTSTGAGVTVAVIDSGVDASHPDLAGQVLPGIDLVAGTSGVSTDPNGHGTHVSGTIAAATGNGVGIAGIAPDARILPVRVLGANGSGTMSAVASGITWAADNGAQVINMSLGSRSQVSAVTNAIAYARSKGVVVVASAGNSRTSGSPTNYPAAEPGVIAVASTDSADQYSTFSNQGAYVDVAAPGTSILSTLPASLGSYNYYSGTSMASPHVAAVAALLKAYATGLGPDEVQQALEKSAVDLGAPGKDVDFGSGRIDAAAALAAVAPVSSAPTTAPTSQAPTATPTVQPSPTATATPSPTKTTPPPPARVTPSVTSDGVSGTVPYGTVVTTTFAVTAGGLPWGRRPAKVCIAEAATSFKCRNTTTTAAGKVAVKRTATAPYRVKLVVSATKTSDAVTSETYSYAVQAVARMEKRGRTLAATLRGAAGQTVQLQRLNAGTWTTVVTYRAVSRYTVRKPVTGAEYRIVVPDTALVTGTVSDSLVM
jgi:type VII secretion-associated serine protease mycosin